MFKVLMHKPDWKKSIIHKTLVIPHHGSYIIPINSYDPSAISHVQYAHIGDIVIRVSHDLVRKVYKKEAYTIREDSKMLVVKKFSTCEQIESYVENMCSTEHVLFPIFKGLDMSIHELFDCSINSRKKIISPLRKLDMEMFEFISDNLKFSRNKDCPILWESAGPLPKWLNTRERLVVDCLGGTINHLSEHWLLRHKNGTFSFPTLEPTKGAKVDGVTGRVIETYTAAPLPMPESVTRAVKITLGVNPVGDEMVGVSWIMYKR